MDSSSSSPVKQSSISPGNRSPGSKLQQGLIYTGFADIKSSVGEQVDSRKNTAPHAVFGSSSRTYTTSGSKSPGPGAYQVPSSIGKPILSTIHAAPACSISGREKFGSTADLKNASNMPGPGDYTSKVVNPRERSAPEYSLGKKWSTLSGGIRKSPGPGAYEAPPTMGKTLLSTQTSNPTPSFTKVERKPLLLTSTADVGPGQYSVVIGSVGKQPVSTLSNAAAYSFGTDERNKPAGQKGFAESVPGPNSYSIRSAVGKQVESTFRTAPKCSMSGRTKFGSHF